MLHVKNPPFRTPTVLLQIPEAGTNQGASPYALKDVILGGLLVLIVVNKYLQVRAHL